LRKLLSIQSEFHSPTLTAELESAIKQAEAIPLKLNEMVQAASLEIKSMA